MTRLVLARCARFAPSPPAFLFASPPAFLLASLLAVLSAAPPTLTAGVEAAEPLKLSKGDRICIIGNTLADRMQHDGWLETTIQARYPELELVFRNLGFSGDEVKTRPRSADFGSPNQWLTKTEADVVLCFFGYNEALRGEGGLPGFEADLASMLADMKQQKYNGAAPPRIVVFSPIAHEDLKSPHLPDGQENNAKLKIYTAAMARVCAAEGVRFVDLFGPTQALYREARQPLTMNGIHLLGRGNRVLATVIDRELFGERERTLDESQLERLRQAVLDRNLHWFSRYRVVDGYNVYGGRSKLTFNDQTNADVMQREMEIFDVKTANRDRRIWAVAQGVDFQVDDSNMPPLLEVKTNAPGPLKGAFPYLEGREAIGKMSVHEGLEVNLFASEEMFPELINPVQMAVDTDSRLWVSCWPSYPHWNPTQPREDKIVILPDDNRDGVADRCVVFADQLNSITGFEFWGGGVLVVAPPEIWFLKDTDGDDKADYRLRILQGVSSADTHHTANALVIGPDGWLYWSRGVFHVTDMETPTKTFRSTTSGVYRFNPRTFEVEFHFPIGPNPHGDVIDRWGYQFVNDGTGGTGSYVNIGHGVGNKQWFRKRVRPVPATGILSSSHFPASFQNNFLITNAIGFLGVLQHEVKYNGADITAEEVDPILVSSDPNFRPSDLEIGGDGALYVADWHNALIGHMQHNIRDPNRDHSHGRVYRVTHPGRPLLEPAKMKGQPVADVLRHFFALENSTRYRARLELSGRESSPTLADVQRFADTLDPLRAAAEKDESQALLECLWTFEEHRVPNRPLLAKVFRAAEPRVRAAAIRTLGHWAGRVDQWAELLNAAGNDDAALVRAEALKAAVEFVDAGVGSDVPAEVVLSVATQPLDPELETVLKYAQGKVPVQKYLDQQLASNKPLSPAALRHVMQNGTVDQLTRLQPSEAVYVAILSHQDADPKHLTVAIGGLAKLRKVSELKLLVDLLFEQDLAKNARGVAGASRLLLQRASEAGSERNRLRRLAAQGKTDAARRAAYAAWIEIDGSGVDAFASAHSVAALRDALSAVSAIESEPLRAKLYPQIQPLLERLPPGVAGAGESGGGEPGLLVDYFLPNPADVALQTLANRTPTASGIAEDVSLKTKIIQKRDAFALRFQGALHIDRGGKYTFYLSSDDGSRLYIDGQEVIDNDGLHGVVEKQAVVPLAPGPHAIVVTYFDNGGGDGLALQWTGPGIDAKQPIGSDRLSTGQGQSIQDLAVATLASLPGLEAEKFRDLAPLVKSGTSRRAAIAAMKQIDPKFWDPKEVRPLADSLIAYLSQLPLQLRTSAPAASASELAKALSGKLPPEQGRAVEQRLQNLDVRVIAIGTAPYRMIYDQDRIVVKAGEPVEFRLSNVDHMPHNLTVTMPGSMEEIGMLAEQTGRDPDALERQYVPRSDKILVASKLLQPGDSQAIAFEAPRKPGVYPIVCTFPGHWRRMYAALYVVEDLTPFQADPEAFFASSESLIQDDLLKLIGKGHEWKVQELIDKVKPLEGPRNFEVGINAFKVAGCVSCHRMGKEEGLQVGPDLTKLEPAKQSAEHILRSLILPSEKIDDKFRSQSLQLDSGETVIGMVLEENDERLLLIENPLAKTKPLTIQKETIVGRKPSDKSIMPEGLANRLTREEILDLVAYVFSAGDKKHMLFHGGHDHGK